MDFEVMWKNLCLTRTLMVKDRDISKAIYPGEKY